MLLRPCTRLLNMAARFSMGTLKTNLGLGRVDYQHTVIGEFLCMVTVWIWVHSGVTGLGVHHRAPYIILHHSWCSGMQIKIHLLWYDPTMKQSFQRETDKTTYSIKMALWGLNYTGGRGLIAPAELMMPQMVFKTGLMHLFNTLVFLTHSTCFISQLHVSSFFYPTFYLHLSFHFFTHICLGISSLSPALSPFPPELA